MTLAEQLEYNWERGFYSVVKDKQGLFWIVSTKMEDLGTGGFRRSLGSNDIEECKASVGSSALTGEQIDICEEKCGWKIVDTIHPSELMGKGFQVGDKVKINMKGDYYNGMNGVIELVINGGVLFNVRVQTGLLLEHISPQDLKPVLPVEPAVDRAEFSKEKKDLEKVLGCKIIVDEEIPYGAMVMFDKKGKAIAMFKDGQIINLS